MGRYYKDGKPGLVMRRRRAEVGWRADFVQAHAWMSLAVSAAAKEGRRVPNYQLDLSRLEGEMTPEQIAEAERLVEEWKPDPASCEALAEG